MSDLKYFVYSRGFHNFMWDLCCMNMNGEKPDWATRAWLLWEPASFAMHEEVFN